MTKKITAFYSLFLALICMTGTVNSAPSYKVWRNGQLNEKYMRSISKHDCMIKSIVTLKTVCKQNESCIQTTGGVLGDCVTWAKGDIETFCNGYDEKYIKRYCTSDYLTEKQCVLINLGNSHWCGKQ